ncbi:polysaccharide biosynthesis PFTS motif protein [bacterium]
MIFIIPKIHLFNLPLCMAVSIFGKIKTFNIHKCGRLIFSRDKIDVIDLEQYFDYNESFLISSSVVSEWDKIMQNYPEALWNIKIGNRNIDFCEKSKQDFKKSLEYILCVNRIIEKTNENIKFIHSLKTKYIYNLLKDSARINIYKTPLLSILNFIFDRFNMYFLNVFNTIKVIISYLKGIFNNSNTKKNIKYIYTGVVSRELSTNRDEITFSWIVNKHGLDKNETVFILPNADFQMKAKIEQCNNEYKLFNYANLLGINCFSKKRCIFNSFISFIKTVYISILTSFFSLRKSIKLNYLANIFLWKPFIDSHNLKVYIVTSSSLGNEEPVVLYLNHLGVKTVEWLYGVNSYLFTSKKTECDFNNIIFSNIIVSDLIVWNEHFKNFIEKHPQPEGLSINVIGPLMCGDESVLDEDKNSLFSKYNIDFNAGIDKKYVAIFDSPVVSDNFKVNKAVFPDTNSTEYNRDFLKDCLRLLDDFKEIVILYKPKRSLVSGKFSYDQDVLSALLNHNRVILFDYNINPWVPIAVCDITISVPFESPAIIGMHYSKPGLFHDAQNIAVHHRYEKLTKYITHSYEELKEKIDLLFNNMNILKTEDISSFTGYERETNSTKKFMAYLKSL